MDKKKSPYIDYTLKDVAQMEGYYFVLQFGGDFVLEDTYYLFTKDEASKIYKKMLKDLVDIVADGSEKDKKYALDLIGGLVIRPMRLH